jgi:hypothetical protein
MSNHTKTFIGLFALVTLLLMMSPTATIHSVYAQQGTGGGSNPGISGGGATGVAGGDLSGSYPNPTVAQATNAFTVKAKIVQAGTAPTASAGTLSGSNNGGYISGLSAATTVTITYANSGWVTWSSCTAVTNVSAVQPYVSAISAASVTFTFPSLTGTLYYHCDGA